MTPVHTAMVTIPVSIAVGFIDFACVLATFQHAFLPPSVELAVENLPPRDEVEFAVDGRHDNLVAHHLTGQSLSGLKKINKTSQSQMDRADSQCRKGHPLFGYALLPLS